MKSFAGSCSDGLVFSSFSHPAATTFKRDAWCVHLQVLEELRAGAVLLRAPPGTGKSTGLPISMLQADLPYLRGKKLLLVQPRDIAVYAIAKRIAHLLGERVGDSVGYVSKTQRAGGTDVRIEVVTDSVLLRRLQRDRTLPGVGAVLLDNFHERGMLMDLALVLTLESMREHRQDLKLVVMSAALQEWHTKPLQRHVMKALDQARKPVSLQCEQPQHSVEMHWRPIVKVRPRTQPAPCLPMIAQVAAALCRHPSIRRAIMASARARSRQRILDALPAF